MNPLPFNWFIECRHRHTPAKQTLNRNWNWYISTSSSRWIANALKKICASQYFYSIETDFDSMPRTRVSVCELYAFEVFVVHTSFCLPNICSIFNLFTSVNELHSQFQFSHAQVIGQAIFFFWLLSFFVSWTKIVSYFGNEWHCESNKFMMSWMAIAIISSDAVCMSCTGMWCRPQIRNNNNNNNNHKDAMHNTTCAKANEWEVSKKPRKM